ncbi:MAG: hypothetical protein L3K04_07275 [Thermoplasmata archaeon]|nr:hypothetical protein [Thermoplasmata archaeon]
MPTPRPRRRAAAPSAPPFRRVLLDTNLLLRPFQRTFRLLPALLPWAPLSSLGIPTSVQGELDRLVARGVPGAAAAAQLAGQFESVPSRAEGDRAMLELAERSGSVVATADRELRQRLHEAGVGVLFPRGSGHLEYLPPGRPGRLPLNGPPRSKRSKERRGGP